MTPRYEEVTIPSTLPPFPGRFTPELTTAAISLTQRDAEGVRVARTGLTNVNKAGSEVMVALAAGKFDDLSKCGVLFAPDVRTGEVAGRLVSPDTPGVTPIRWNAKKGVATVYLHGVFKANPRLRPISDRWVSMSRVSDPEYGDFFIIHLNLGLVRARVSRNDSDEAKAKAKAKAQVQAKEQSKAQNKEQDAEKAAENEKAALTAVLKAVSSGQEGEKVAASQDT